MKYKLILFIIMSGIAFAAQGQVSITGPSCVLAGIEYEYLISTPDTAGKGIKVCLDGGTYQGLQETCLNDSLISSVFVTWNTGITTASVSFSSPSGNTSTSVQLTTPLQPGNIDSSSSLQTVGYDSLAPGISCSVALGGSCSPIYGYQWQQSGDDLNWTDIVNATTQDLNPGIILTETTYFRRKVTETNSGSIAYSGSVVIYVSQAGTVSTGATPERSVVLETRNGKLLFYDKPNRG